MRPTSAMAPRPTESTIVWIQQFGRGLRRAAGKGHLTVVDYIGNHRIFLTKARALLGCGEGERALRLQLEKVADHSLALPPGCEITYELEALEMLQRLMRPAARGDAFEAWYLDFKERFGGRPTALDMFHAGFNPRTSGHGRWFDFVRDRGDLTVEEARALTAAPDFLNVVATTQMSRSYKMLLLAAMRREGALPGQVGIDALTARFVALAASPRLSGRCDGGAFKYFGRAQVAGGQSDRRLGERPGDGRASLFQLCGRGVWHDVPGPRRRAGGVRGHGR